ncbi:hypothetical protein [Paenibacillus soyae]|uniref:Uncharacterized protein n=1 Tax=Paenibacillus soyae TaxID=2969249 RepID=A0A9X2MN40_9BACL|nr:hypothetical protein [Paenibacillus soyae]MCR2803340.1 hypothetical protein [Paenibacillus soyae]
MRAILTSMLLIVTVVLIYTTVADGEDGLKSGINRSGSAMSDYVKGMSP